MEEWTTDELRRAVKAYVKMHRDEKLSKTFVKKEIYARLHKRLQIVRLSPLNIGYKIFRRSMHHPEELGLKV